MAFQLIRSTSRSEILMPLRNTKMKITIRQPLRSRPASFMKEVRRVMGPRHSNRISKAWPLCRHHQALRGGTSISSYNETQTNVWTLPGFSRWYFNFTATTKPRQTSGHHQALAGGTSISQLQRNPDKRLDTTRL